MLTRGQLQRWILGHMHQKIAVEHNTHFLLVNDLRPTGAINNFSLQTQHRNIDREELIEAWVAVEDLIRGGYLAYAFDSNQWGAFTITRRGRELHEAGGNGSPQQVPLDEMVRDRELLDRCAVNFQNRDFDAAVMIAFKVVEERLRQKAQLPSELVGRDLVGRALNPNPTGGGVLKYPGCQTSDEHQGLFNLFHGVVGFLRNPSAHRTVEYDDPQHAQQVVAFADFLLTLIAQMVPRHPVSA